MSVLTPADASLSRTLVSPPHHRRGQPDRAEGIDVGQRHVRDGQLHDHVEQSVQGRVDAPFEEAAREDDATPVVRVDAQKHRHQSAQRRRPVFVGGRRKRPVDVVVRAGIIRHPRPRSSKESSSDRRRSRWSTRPVRFASGTGHQASSIPLSMYSAADSFIDDARKPGRASDRTRPYIAST